MKKTSRRNYMNHLCRVYKHLDWYFEEIFKNQDVAELPMPKILSELQDPSGVKIREETVLRYNSRQFIRYQTAPLEWAGDDIYRLNLNYYDLLSEKVFAPRIGKRDPPKKYTRDENELDNNL